MRPVPSLPCTWNCNCGTSSRLHRPDFSILSEESRWICAISSASVSGLGSRSRSEHRSQVEVELVAMGGLQTGVGYHVSTLSGSPAPLLLQGQ